MLLRAVLVDGSGNQGGLHGKGRAVATVHGLDLPGQETIGHVGDAGSVLFDGAPQHSHVPQLFHDALVEDFLSVGLDDSGHELLLAILPEAISHGFFFVSQLGFKVERVFPVEGIFE